MTSMPNADAQLPADRPPGPPGVVAPGRGAVGAAGARRDPLPATLPVADRWATYAIAGAVFLVVALLPAVAPRAKHGWSSPLTLLPPLASEMGIIHLAWSNDLPQHGIAVNRASALAQEPALFHPWWWVLGWVRLALGRMPLDVIWAILAALLAGLLLVALRALLLTVLPDDPSRARRRNGQTRLVAFLLIVLAGGWRWVHFAGMALGILSTPIYAREFWTSPADALRRGTAFGSPLVDTWIAPERLGIMAVEALLLALIARALLATSWRRVLLSWLGAALALAALQPLAPGSFRVAALATFPAVIFAGSVWSWSWTRRLGHVAGLGMLLALTWPVHRWYMGLAAAEPAWAHLWTHGDPALVYPGHVLVALGTVAALGLAWGVGRVAGSRTSLHPLVATLLVGWAVCSVWPASVEQLVAGGRALDLVVLAALPLAVLGADVLVAGLGSMVSPRIGHAVIGLAIVANLPALGFYGVSGLRLALDPALALVPADLAVLGELDRRDPAGAVTLTDGGDLDRLVLAMTGKRTAGGWLTELRGHAGLLRREFFAGTASGQRQEELLEALGVRFVLYDSADGWSPHPSPLLRVASVGARLTLLSVHPPPEPQPRLRAGDLARHPSGMIYVFDGRRRRWIPDLETFAAGGYRGDQVQTLSGWQLATIPEGYPVPRAVRGKSAPAALATPAGTRSPAPSRPNAYNLAAPEQGCG